MVEKVKPLPETQPLSSRGSSAARSQAASLGQMLWSSSSPGRCLNRKVMYLGRFISSFNWLFVYTTRELFANVCLAGSLGC